ncbi:hypothetical protein FB470_005497 [Amycolatopsis thermophila]|uniref:Uncharacterized protein n=1 Tax=Amycolatopsis thermophila TaxID=206084 RepID=A0ABU0F278_9PSEU|nr:hypothetical protein [Amycolatopsis thermophila]
MLIPGPLILGDKGAVSRELDTDRADRGVRLLQPSYRNRTPHPAQNLLKPVRQPIESLARTAGIGVVRDPVAMPVARARAVNRLPQQFRTDSITACGPVTPR